MLMARGRPLRPRPRLGSLHETKLDPFLGLDCCGVLGDALRDERGLARRLSNVA